MQMISITKNGNCGESWLGTGKLFGSLNCGRVALKSQNTQKV